MWRLFHTEHLSRGQDLPLFRGTWKGDSQIGLAVNTDMERVSNHPCAHSYLSTLFTRNHEPRCKKAKAILTLLLMSDEFPIVCVSILNVGLQGPIIYGKGVKWEYPKNNTFRWSWGKCLPSKLDHPKNGKDECFDICQFGLTSAF